MDSITFQRLLALVNSALWDKQIDENLFNEIDSEKWKDLYHFSIRHGVLAISFDGLMKLPTTLHPPLNLRMAWTLGSEQIEQNYKHISGVAKELNCLFKKEGMDMLIFKGLSLSAYYPIPAYREFGDIDIFLFGKHAEGNLLLDKIALKKEGSFQYKHSNYYYKDIMIENHAYLLNVRDSSQIAKLDKKLLDILQKNDINSKTKEDKLHFPPIKFTALFFIIHAIKHLSGAPLQLRTYCDWALFLKAHIDELNIEEWRSNLREAGLLDIAEAMTNLTFKWMEIPVNLPIHSCIHAVLEERISNEMLRPFYPSCQSETLWGVFAYKYKRFYARNKRYVSFHGGNFYSYFISSFYSSFIDHVKNPGTIFKFQ
ncbi:MAG: nucleotidyltransferase family protein [Prevotella sp.]|jgi:hypothetical protein|nr:nucleotidyltransferase family protein [Prevotella sp.]